MAWCLHLPLLSFNKKQPFFRSSSSPASKGHRRIISNIRPKQCHLTTNVTSSTPPPRRTTNYRPNWWNYNYIQSLPIDFMEEKYTHQRDKLKEEVKHLIGQQHGLLEQLELVDSLCQLGVGYHFDSEIKDLLSFISSSMENINNLIENNNLHGSSLLFRLLREHGIENASILRVDALISCFKRVREIPKPNHEHNIKEMLSLYEASHLAVEGEEDLDEARKFAMEYLTNSDRSLLSPELNEKINHALELPLRWRMSRLHNRWFIDAYGRQENVNTVLLELAKLDFNIVQNIYKIEFKELSRWWKNSGLVSEVTDFSRDRTAENFIWAAGFTFQPKFWRCREAIFKNISLIIFIDDIYDVYGSLDELKIFTRAIEEWKIAGAQRLPNVMKICLATLFSTIDDIASSFSKEKGLDILPYLKRAWIDLCKGYLTEAEWYYTGYTPKLDDYLENAWVSITGALLLTIIYCSSDDLTIEACDSWNFYPPMVQYSSIILRLYDDLGTSSEEVQRGDNAKSIQCYMKEKNVSEPVARDYVRCLIRNFWKKLNGELNAFSTTIESYKEALTAIPKAGQFFYQHGDGYGMDDGKIREKILSILVEPIL